MNGQDTSSQNVISKLTQFIETNKGKAIDELFFYFSGHGIYDEEELFFCLSDYVDSKKRRTSLINSEVDSMFKSLDLV